MRVILAVVCLSGCATPAPVIPPPEIIEIPKYTPAPEPCGEEVTLDLPVGSTAIDVMSKQKQAIDELNSQIKRCFRPASTEIL
jgi:hypothetical protein